MIAGAGHAGFQLAASLRQHGFSAPIRLINDEAHLPYQRPPLSKAYLKGEGRPDSLMFRPDKFYRDQNIELIGDRAVAIDRGARQVLLASGSSLAYGHLVLATGARNRLLDIPNANLPDVRYLRMLDDSEVLRQRIASYRHVVVIGAGFIGLEFAATARAKGLEVDVVELGARVMARAVTAEISDYFQDRHTAAGIRIHLGVQATSIESDGENVTGVSLSDGRHLTADLVVVGVGVLPNVELAAEAGLPVAAGIIVNEQLLTADPDISAIGDCALFASPRFGGSLRLESVQNATDHARCVAARLAGNAKTYDGQPWFWSDQGEDKRGIADWLCRGLGEWRPRAAIVLGVLLQVRATGRRRVGQPRLGPRVRTENSRLEPIDRPGAGARSRLRSEGGAGVSRLLGSIEAPARL